MVGVQLLPPNAFTPLLASTFLFTIGRADIGQIKSAWINEIHYDDTGVDMGEFVDEIVLPEEQARWLAQASSCGWSNITNIHDIQGSSSRSLMIGADVVTEGLVTAVEGGLGGYFIQNSAAMEDADVGTSEGIFVYAPSLYSDVTVGDHVVVEGSVREFRDKTQVTVSRHSVCSAGNALPEVRMISHSADSLEVLEGMLVRIEDVVITDTHDLARWGEFRVSRNSSRQTWGTQLLPPGEDAMALNAFSNSIEMTIGDGRTTVNPDPVIFPSPELSATNTLRSGYMLTSATGPLDYSFNRWKIVASSTADAVIDSTSNPRTAAPAVVSGTMRVGSFNVLNFASELDFPQTRGAHSQQEYERQLRKTVSALVALDADVLGLVEIQNDGFGNGNSSIDALVDAVNAAQSKGAYTAVPFVPEMIGMDVISSKIIYRASVVTQVGTSAVLDSSFDSKFLDTKNRPVVAASFEDATTGESFTVAVTHLKGKGSSCDAEGDPDRQDGAGNCNIVRRDASDVLGKWLETSPTGVGTDKIIIVGDMNTYAMEQPIRVLVEKHKYEDMVRQFEGPDAYTYVYQGVSGYLDYFLASSAMAACVTGLDVWHINADEPSALDYNMEFKNSNQENLFYDAGPFRSSDHDPVLAGIDLSLCTSNNGGEEANFSIRKALGLAPLLLLTLVALSRSILWES